METPQEVCEKCKPLFERLLKEIEELKRRLLAFENAHTPPSQQRKYPSREKTGNPMGAPIGHVGTTRPTPKPNKFEVLKLVACPHCNKRLGGPRSIKKKIIEDIPEPQPLIITEFTIPHYFCNNCNIEVIPSHPELPDEGKFGPNLQAQIALMKHEDRLPHRKIANTLNRQYELRLTPATILDVTRRVADKLQGMHDAIKQEVRNSPHSNVDETGIKVRGEKFWSWVFVTPCSILYAIRKSRGQKTLKELLGEYFGIVTCDGWKPYASCIKKLQRCWAHLLREAKWYAERYKGQAELLWKALQFLFKKIKKVTLKTSDGAREKIYHACIEEMQAWIKTCKAYRELRKFVEKIERGLEDWFTCILHPEIEPTNNNAERALRELVVQRKISSLWNEKGVRIKEIIMSVLATWNLRGLNTYNLLRETLSS